jgi:signal peptidase II
MPDPRPAPRPPTRLKVVSLVLVVLGVVLDLASKAWMQGLLEMDPSDPNRSKVIEVVPGFFRLEGTWNTGITFGLAAGKTEAILVFTVVACAGLLAAILFLRTRSAALHVALALILGGAIGNLHDRWTWQKVRDFIVVYWKDPSIWQWYAFNAADSMIVVGVALILWHEIFGTRGAHAEARA